MKKYNYNFKRRTNGIKSNNISNFTITISTTKDKIEKKIWNLNKHKKWMNNNVNNWKKHKKTSERNQLKQLVFIILKENQN